MTRKLNFEVERAEIVDTPVNSQFATARVRAFNTGKSLHDTFCDLETLQRTAPTLYEKPIIFELDKRFGDFGSHNDGVTVPAGFVIPGSATYKEEEDGRTSLNVLVKIWKKYSGKFLEIFADTNTEKKPVSVEMELNDYVEMPDGLLKLLDFTYSAICVLGDLVTPASPNSELEMLSFAKEETEEYNDVFNKEFSSSRYSDIDFEIPDYVKESCQMALDLSKEKGFGSPLSLANARYISKNKSITPERIRVMYKKLQKEDMDEFSAGLWGGYRAFKWAQNLVTQMDEADEREIKYFDSSRKNIIPAASLQQIEMEEINHMAKNEKEEVVAEEIAAPAETETPAETPAENFAAEPESSAPADESAKAKFDYAQYCDSNQFMSYFAEDEEDDEDTKAKFSAGKAEFEAGENVGVMMSAVFAAMKKMQAKMGRMAEEANAYMSENAELKKFKAETEEKEKQFAVQETLRELSEKANIPDDVRTEILTEAEKYSLETLDGWKNFAKAKSFDFAKPTEKTEENDGIIGIGFSFYNDVKPTNDLWA